MSPPSPASVLVVLYGLVAAAQPGVQPGDASDGLQPAPAAVTSAAPPETALAGAPDAEKQLLPPGFIEIWNPAFPTAAPPPPVVHRGKRFEPGDLAPYFADGELAAAHADFEAGRYAKARERLSSAGDALPVRYLRALSALRAGDHRVAAEEMEPLANEYPAMRDRCLTHAAMAREQLGEYAAAAALYDQVVPHSKLFPDARLGLARSRRQLKDFTGAIAALEGLASRGTPGWGRDAAAEALMATADLYRDLGDTEGERAALLKLWSTHPLSALADQAARRLPSTALTLEARVTRAEALVEAHRNRQGIAVLKPLTRTLKLPDPLACRAHFSLGKALRKEREHHPAIAVLAPVVEQCADPELRPRALYVLASSRSIVRAHEGPGTYELLARDYPAHPFADDALFYAADLDLKNGDPAKALERLAAIGTSYPNGDFASEAMFKAFWIQRSAGEIEKALATLDRIEKIFATAAETYDVERARYWRARVEAARGKEALALQLYEQVAKDHPATYYGLMSRIRLAEADEARADAVIRAVQQTVDVGEPWPLFAGPMGDDLHFLAGVELLRMGFPEAAASELLAVNRANQPLESLRLLVRLLSAANDPRAAHAVARSALRQDLSGRMTSANRPTWEVAYPNAFRPLIERHCQAAGFDPDLLQALMREESALDPRALSWAGALGLTQLMPSTARAVARELKIQRVTTQSLLDPDMNIKLGAAYLGRLVRRFDGTLPYAIASYNAGATAIDRWRDANAKELDEWVEEIPISETRGYVKRVLRTYNTYQLVYGRSAPATTLKLGPARSASLARPPTAG